MLRPGRGNAGNLPTTYGGSSTASVGYGGGDAGYGGYSASTTSAVNGGASNTGYSSYGNGAGSFGTKEKQRSPRSRNGSFAFDGVVSKLKNPGLWGYVLAIVFFFAMLSYRSGQNQLLQSLGNSRKVKDALFEITTSQRQKDSLQLQLKTARETQQMQRQKNMELETNTKKLQNQVDELQKKHEGPEREIEKLKLKTREDAWKNQVQLLQQATSRESRRAATEKFGPGPHFVKITVQIIKSAVPTTQSFTVQMAPLDSMPHAVHLFLEQVSHKLWNRGWFYINGPHVMQAGPQADFDAIGNAAEAMHNNSTVIDERSLALAPFRQLQLDSLAFPEYSEDFPHEPYTLGFTGRPGGPDWYINKVDNTKAHGPGGQFHHELEEFADSCFAKVVDGFDVIKTMMELPTVQDPGDYLYFYEVPVFITNMAIVDDPKKPIAAPPTELEEHIDLTGSQLKEALKETTKTGEATLMELLRAIKHVQHPDNPSTADESKATTNGFSAAAGVAKLTKEEIEMHVKRQKAALGHVVDP